jgi:hybrid cluster-associated redox disulfide protein
LLVHNSSKQSSTIAAAVGGRILPDALTSMIVADVMNRWPETVPVFVLRRMACPGCVMAQFMTIADAAKEYGLHPAEFAVDLRAVISSAANSAYV